MEKFVESLTRATGKLLGLPVLASEQGRHVDNLIIYVHANAGMQAGWWVPGFVAHARNVFTSNTSWLQR